MAYKIGSDEYIINPIHLQKEKISRPQMIDKLSCAFKYFYSFVKHPNKEPLTQKSIRKLFCFKMLEIYHERAIFYTGHKKIDTLLKYYIDRRTIDKEALSSMKIGLSLNPQEKVLKIA